MKKYIAIIVISEQLSEINIKEVMEEKEPRFTFNKCLPVSA